MKRILFIGVILSCFLLLVTPYINAIEHEVIKKKLDNEMERSLKGIQNLISIFDNYSLTSIFFVAILSIMYVIGYVTYFIALFLYFDYPSMDRLIAIILCFILSFFWPILFCGDMYHHFNRP
jgi:hypothetical protein